MSVPILHRIFILASVLIAGLCPLPAFAAEPAVPPEIADRLKLLESQLASVKTLKVNFIQEKQLAILEQKLILKGRITLSQPDKIAWRVQSPIRYAMIVEGATLRQWSGDTNAVQQFSLAGNPAFNAAVKQIQSWFSGNYLSLAREFKVEILADAPLALQFTPLAGTPACEMIQRIVTQFGSDERFLKTLEVDETSGDKMRIDFSGTSINPHLSVDEWEPRHE